MQLLSRAITLAALALVVFGSPAAAQGIKFGPTFATFSSDALDFKTRTGLHAGLFLGGSRDKTVGFQTEFNWLRKKAGTQSGQNIRIDYLQLPTLLRVNGGSRSANGFGVYGIVGPAFSFKIGDEIEGFTLDDGFEGTDVSLVFGGGIEVVRIIVEGRYEKGFRRINNSFSVPSEIKTQAFTILFGLRFK
ncbi:MAG TPA: porin family protein [Vicinamibacterales bacterium]|nr:porin family protein [Vicinamibacterales bacterium]